MQSNASMRWLEVDSKELREVVKSASQRDEIKRVWAALIPKVTTRIRPFEEPMWKGEHRLLNLRAMTIASYESQDDTRSFIVTNGKDIGYQFGGRIIPLDEAHAIIAGKSIEDIDNMYEVVRNEWRYDVEKIKRDLEATNKSIFVAIKDAQDKLEEYRKAKEGEAASFRNI